MSNSKKRREGLVRTNYFMMFSIVYIVGVDIIALFYPPGTFGVWRVAGVAFFLVIIMIRFLISEAYAEVAIEQHRRMWEVLKRTDSERAKIANDKGDFSI